MDVVSRSWIICLGALLASGIAGSAAAEPERGQEPIPYSDVQTFDGTGNSLRDPSMGAAGTTLRRLVDSAYADGVGAMSGGSRPSPREISNAVHAQSSSRPNASDASDILWQWGQFVDHDIDLTEAADPGEAAPVPIPMGDPYFDPFYTGTVSLAFDRSHYAPWTGHSLDAPREQMNSISAWIDGSNIYGSDSVRAAALRRFDGSGMLETSEGGLLPFNAYGLPNAGGTSPELFLAGDVRANEQLGLIAMHTLFVREHNRIASQLARVLPHLSGDQIFERARRWVIAELQVITYEEYLPALLGPDAIPPYRGYDPEVDARISNLFATAAYRYGHSALNSQLLRLDAQGNEVEAGHLPLRDAFFAPWRIAAEGGIDPILRGLCAQRAQSIDPYVIDDVRNFLFGPPGAGGLDLAALNIQRGRDHGLPSYNAARASLGLKRKRGFSEITSDAVLAERLASVYDSVEDVDVWVGALSEDPVPGAMVGELVHKVVRDQFIALRDGDRFWYRRELSRKLQRRVERIRLIDVIRWNTAIDEELPNDVFHVRGGE